MDILFQIHYEWNKELFCLYYQTQNRKYRRILLFFCGAVIIFSFCLCSKIGREMIMTMMILFVCAVILINNISETSDLYTNGNCFKTVWNWKKNYDNKKR